MTDGARASATAGDHFRLYLQAAIARVIDRAAQAYPSLEALLAAFPFLAGYLDDLPEPGWRDPSLWARAVDALEADHAGHLPLRALRRAAGLEHDALTLLLALGLQEEDARFGLLFDAAQGTSGQQHPTLGLVSAWWRRDGVRGDVERLRALGLIGVPNETAPRSCWSLQIAAPVWDALRGEAPVSPALGFRYHAPADLVPAPALVADEALVRDLARLPGVIRTGELPGLVVRGDRHSGRRTVLGTIAHALGRGLLVAEGLGRPDDDRWRLLAGLSLLLRALPVVVLEPAPGETVEVPALDRAAAAAGLFVVLPRHGGARGPGIESAVALDVEPPTASLRSRHWRGALGEAAGGHLDAIARQFRVGGGTIRRLARVARARAALDGRGQVEAGDVADALRTFQRQRLDTLAVRIEGRPSWSTVALAPATAQDLRDLESRCRLREDLGARGGGALRVSLNPGVRALFQGPSGTGKTLAARLLGGQLGKDVYRVDLAAAVSKYIGETEKNLHQVFSIAEELDVVLLLDEGDALLGQRTSVHSSTDRYANLETNYLLQRLEAYQGIVVITTNASDQIDRAFLRRMDAVVDFRSPDASDRHTIWQLHLPDDHQVEPTFLRDVAVRCLLSGGQIRNAVLHATLLATTATAPLTTPHLEAAVQREYRKLGAVCPLRAPATDREALRMTPRPEPEPERKRS